jgi:hypothetical protein
MVDNSNYQLATPEDFTKFRNACDSTENWNICYVEGEDLKVWDQKVRYLLLYCNYIQNLILFAGRRSSHQHCKTICTIQGNFCRSNV